MDAIITEGFSMNDFQEFENLAAVAPSIMRWSADQDTCITVRGITSASPLQISSFTIMTPSHQQSQEVSYSAISFIEASFKEPFFTYFGRVWNLPMAPIITWGTTNIGTMYVPPILPIITSYEQVKETCHHIRVMSTAINTKYSINDYQYWKWRRCHHSIEPLSTAL